MLLRILTFCTALLTAAATVCVIRRKKPGPKRWYQKIGLTGSLTISATLLSAVVAWKVSADQEAGRRRLEALTRPKAPKLQFFVSDNVSNQPGTLMQVGIVTIPLNTKPRQVLFSLQNTGEISMEGLETTIRFDSRLSFQHDLKLSETDSILPPKLPENESQIVWLQPRTIHPFSMAVLQLSFSPTNLLNTPMNLNFFANAKGMDPFPVLLTLLFTSGTGTIQTIRLPGELATNGPFTVTTYTARRTN